MNGASGSCTLWVLAWKHFWVQASSLRRLGKVTDRVGISPLALLRLIKVSDACEDNFAFDPEGLLYTPSHRGLVGKCPGPYQLIVHVSSTTTSLINICRSLSRLLFIQIPNTHIISWRSRLQPPHHHFSEKISTIPQPTQD